MRELGAMRKVNGGSGDTIVAVSAVWGFRPVVGKKDGGELDRYVLEVADATVCITASFWEKQAVTCERLQLVVGDVMRITCISVRRFGDGFEASVGPKSEFEKGIRGTRAGPLVVSLKKWWAGAEKNNVEAAFGREVHWAS